MKVAEKFSFIDFDSRGLDAVNDLVDHNVDENVRLEFKAFSGDNKLNEIKGKIKQALCAFANTYGGVLVLGIDRKHGGATRKEPLGNLTSLEDDLRRSLNNLLQTATPIKLQSIPEPTTEGSGFLVLGIDESVLKPVMTSDCDVYIRRDSSSKKVSQLELIALTLTGRQVNLSVDVSAAHDIYLDNECRYTQCRLDLYIVNSGWRAPTNLSLYVEQNSLLINHREHYVGLPIAMEQLSDDNAYLDFVSYQLNPEVTLFPKTRILVARNVIVKNIERGFRYVVNCNEGSFWGSKTRSDFKQG